MEFRILGPFDVVGATGPVELRGAKRRGLLACLVTHAPEAVGANRLVAHLWGDRAPDGAVRTVQTYVSQIRKLLLSEGVIVETRPEGYVLRAEPDALDAHRFERVVAGAGQERDPGRRLSMLDTALGWWRGPPLREFAGAAWADDEARRLESLHLQALHLRFDALLALSRPDDAIAELEHVARAHPLDERFWVQLMLALYRRGRQADALAAYQQARRHLLDELGIEPGPELTALEHRILDHDPTLVAPPPPGAAVVRHGLPVSGEADGRHPDVGTRLVALVRTDVVDSTPLTLRLGDDDASSLFQRHLRLLEGVIEAYDGTLVKTLGDGVVAAFASASTAVRASREMQASIHQHNRLHANLPPLHIRVGVSVGDVIWAGGDIDGRPAIEAERLQAAAQPDQILCSHHVVELTGGRFDTELRSLGARALKGYPREVEVFEVGWQPAEGRPDDLSPALRQEPRTPFVARDDDIALVLKHWERAEQGSAGVVLVEGEAGIGKSRLVREVALRAHEMGATVLFGRCTPDRAQPYEPFVQALDHFVGHVRGQRYRLGTRAADLAPLLPGLAERVPGLAVPVSLGDSGDIDEAAERASLREAVWGWLAEASADDAVLFVVEDIHWADVSTLSLLQHIVASLSSERLLLLVTVREPDDDRGGAELTRLRRQWRRATAVTGIELGGLSAAGAADLLESITLEGLDGRVETEFARRLWQHTGGNPLFIESVLGHLVNRRVLVERDGRWSSSVALAQMGVPNAVHDVVQDRLAAAADDDRAVLQLAALLGSVVDLGLLSDVAEQLGLEAGPSFEWAYHEGLLVGAQGSPGCYRFSHEIVREVVADDVPATRRADLHRQIARTMEARYPSATEEQAEELSRQLSFSPDVDDRLRSAAYARAAAAHAESRRALEKAASLHRRAAELLANTGDDVGRCEALLNAGRAARKAGDPSARATLFEAVHLADLLGDGVRTARAALACSRGMFSMLGSVDVDLVDALERALVLLDDGDSPLRASVLAALGAELTYSHDRARHQQVCDLAVAMARRLADPVCLARVLTLYANTLLRPDRVGERLHLAEELEHITAGLGRPQWRFSAASLGFQAAMEAGAFAVADERMLQMESLARQLDQPAVWSYLWLRQGLRKYVAGDLVEAERLAAEAVERGRAAGYRDSEIFYYGQMWVICYHAGRLDELCSLSEHLVAARPGHTVLRAALAAIYAETGQAAQCERMAEQLGADDFNVMDQDLLVSAAVATIAACRIEDIRLANVLRPVLTPYEGQLVDNGSAHFGAVSHYLAMLAGLVGDQSQATMWFENAATTHSRLREWPMLARTWLEHGRMLVRAGGPGATDAARELLGRSLALAKEKGFAGTVTLAEQDLEALRSRIS
jgi:DNA-binding SARP family transcriptional activator/class 3 adenylate cyclase